ncbi:hypothetical protein AGMMS49992_24070 [Clostridia bacterium]|nr:hypothetical protein AGMMS49992_24070 [Clostridia bacterium]
MSKTQPETFIRDIVRATLRADGWFVFYIFQGLGCYSGIADLCAIKNGRVVWLEIKTQRGRQSDAQVRFQQRLEAHGGVYRVVRGLEDVSDLIESPQPEQMRLAI